MIAMGDSKLLYDHVTLRWWSLQPNSYKLAVLPVSRQPQ